MILIVNDVPDHMHGYAKAFAKHGYEVRVTNTGAGGLALARALKPTCAVIDVRLPDMTGWVLCSAFKADPQLSDVPVVVLTQDIAPTTAHDSRRSGCAAWLARPTVAEDVVRAVAQVLTARKSEPATDDDAVLGIRACPACHSTRIRAGVGVGTVQYYACSGCGFRWRVSGDVAATG